MITPPSDDKDQLQVHLIDFGMAKKFFDDETNEHIKEGYQVDEFEGNMFYSSLH